jgi:hypothetical protein
MGDEKKQKTPSGDEDATLIQEKSNISASNGYMGFKVKSHIIIIWIIIILNLVLSWASWFILIGLNVERMNELKKKNTGVMFAKTMMLFQGFMSLCAFLFLMSMMKQIKFAVIPLALFFLLVSIFSFILSSRLGKVNKKAQKGTLDEKTMTSATSFAVALAAGYTGVMFFMIAYIYIFQPRVYEYLHYKLSAALTFRSYDDDDDYDENDIETDTVSSNGRNDSRESSPRYSSRGRQATTQNSRSRSSNLRYSSFPRDEMMSMEQSRGHVLERDDATLDEMEISRQTSNLFDSAASGLGNIASSAAEALLAKKASSPTSGAKSSGTSRKSGYKPSSGNSNDQMIKEIQESLK